MSTRTNLQLRAPAPAPAEKKALAIPQGSGPARFLPPESSARKTIPMGSGLLDYFPDALAYVAFVSYKGNEQHNPGQPLHHARGKSSDHSDTIIRHFVERGTLDSDGIRHSGKMAWRALALLQQELELVHNLPLPRGATAE